MAVLEPSATPVDEASSGAVPAQRRRCLAPMPCGRIVRQVDGIDAWNRARRQEALRGSSGGSRDEQLDRARRLDVLRRTHAAVLAATARELVRPPAPMLWAAPTVVVAHHHLWFRDTVCALLAEHGFDVLERTDNGADALGAIIAEQPDLVLVGDRLAMMTGADLLSETARFSPLSVRLAQADLAGTSTLTANGADPVLLRQVPLADLVDDAARLVDAPARIDAAS